MEATAHISEQMLDRYIRRETGPDEIRVVQGHVATCTACRSNLASRIDFNRAFANIRAGFLAEEEGFEHLSFGQLEGLVDGKVDEVDAEIAESHFAVCTACTNDLANLRMYREIAEANVEPHEQKAFWSFIFDLPRVAMLAPAGLLILIATAAVVWFTITKSERGQIVANANLKPTANEPVQPPQIIAEVPLPAASPQTEVSPMAKLALNDGSISMTADGSTRGLETLPPHTRELVDESLRSKKVLISNHSLGGSTGILMGARRAPAAGVPFRLETPVGKVIREAQPLLKWRSVEQAASYSVAVVDEQFRVVAESGEQQSTSWKPGKPLSRGANYSWQVTATLKDGTKTISPSNPAPQARFRIVEQYLVDEIERAEQRSERSHLELGVLYAKAGLRVEAKMEFTKLVKANPDSRIARRLLQSVK